VAIVGCFKNFVRMFSRSFLLKIGFCMPAIALLLQDWYTLWHFGINAHSPTRRGRRSGTRKIRAIALIITKHGQCNQTPSRGCQIGNLVPVYCCEFITTLIRQRYMSPTPACSVRKPPVANQRNLVQINITRQPAFEKRTICKDDQDGYPEMPLRCKQTLVNC